MLNAPGNAWKPLQMIDARSYFDDSGTHRQSVVTILGGYVATKEVWDELERPWRTVLNEFKDRGVRCFHATNCLSQEGQFNRLEKWECHYIYKQLSDILEKTTAQPIWTAVWSNDWRAVSDENFHKLFPSAYDFCVDRVIHELVNWSSHNAGGTKVPIVIARQKDHEAETTRTAESWFRVDVVGDRIGPLAFAFPDSLVPLQAADMLAHEAYRHLTWRDAMEHSLPLPPERPHPPVLDKIMRGRRLSAGLFDHWFLETYAGGIREVKG